MKRRYSWVLVDAKEMQLLIRRVKSLGSIADGVVSLAKMPVLGDVLLTKEGSWDEKSFRKERKLEFFLLLEVVLLIFWPMFEAQMTTEDQRLVSLIH